MPKLTKRAYRYGLTDGQKDGQTDLRTDGLTDGQSDGLIYTNYRKASLLK